MNTEAELAKMIRFAELRREAAIVAEDWDERVKFTVKLDELRALMDRVKLAPK